MPRPVFPLASLLPTRVVFFPALLCSSLHRLPLRGGLGDLFPPRQLIVAVTIHDLAQMANTSTATISRVLSGKPGVSAAKRASILRLAEQIGYTPNRIAQNLALNKSHLIGLIASALDNTTYVQFFQYMQHHLEARGYRVLIADSELNVEKERHHIAMMREQRVEGMIVFPVHDWRSSSDIEHFLQLRLQKFPLVLVGRVEGFGLDCVTSEEVQTAHELTRHLIGLGHREFAFVGGDPANRCIVERKAGVQQALAEAGLTLKPEHDIADREGWVEELKGVLQRRGRPTALIFINDVCALFAHPMIVSLGLQMPGELSVVAFDDNIWSRYLTPALTTTRERIEEITGKVLEMLFSRIENPGVTPEQHLIAQDIVMRASTARAPGS